MSRFNVSKSINPARFLRGVSSGGSSTSLPSFNTSSNSSYTLVLSDSNNTVNTNSSSSNTLTVPSNSSVPFEIGTQINIIQVGTGQTTVAASGGVTLNSTPGLKLRTQWSAATLIKRDTDSWVLIGDLTV